jgi:RNA polymerase sigma factor (TIGR02999 family)
MRAPTLTHDSEPDTLLARAQSGDPEALEALVRRIYDDLRRVAARMMEQQRPGHTLQPSALVNEAILHLLGGSTLRSAASREHLYAAAVTAMRRILVDHHRARSARKRGGGLRKQPLDLVLDHFAVVEKIDFLDLDAALDDLSTIDTRAALVASQRLILGFTLSEVARNLNISLSTADRDWDFAVKWLRGRLAHD